MNRTEFEKTKDFEQAGFQVRLKALAYDFGVILVYLACLTGVNAVLFRRGLSLDNRSALFEFGAAWDLVAFLTLILPVLLYFSMQESSASMASWGKRKAGLQVVDEKGGRLTRGRAVLRSVVKFLPWQLAHTSIYQAAAAGFGDDLPAISLVGFALAYLLAGCYFVTAWRGDRRTPYDRIAGAFVVTRMRDQRDSLIPSHQEVSPPSTPAA